MSYRPRRNTGVGVTRTEFESHQRHVDQRFRDLDESTQRGFSGLTAQFEGLSRKLDQQTKPNYSLLTIGVMLAGFAGALIQSNTSHVGELSESRDKALLAEIDNLRNGSNRWSYGQQQDYKKETQSKFDSIDEAQKKTDRAITSLGGDLKSLAATVSTWIDELHIRGPAIEKNTTSNAVLEERVSAMFERIGKLEGLK